MTASDEANSRSPYQYLQGTDRPAAGNRETWLIPLALVAVVFVTFIPVLQNGFVWDDTPNLETNEGYRGLSTTNLRWMFTTFHMGHYQPLSWLSLGIDYVLWSDKPVGYHLTSLLLHALNAVLVFFLAVRLFDRADASRLQTYGHYRVGAVLAALLFAVHPLRVESVAWVTERRDVLSAFFILATVLLYLKAHHPQRKARRTGLMILAWCVFVLSLLSKAGGVALPIVLLVLDWYPLRRLGGGKGRWASREVRDVWLEKVPFIVAAAFFAVLAGWAQTHAEATAFWMDHTIVGRFAQACFGLVFYICKTLSPLNLLPLYQLYLPLDPLSFKYLGSIVGVFVAAVILLIASRRLPGLAAAGLCYALILAPVLGFLQSGSQEVADRYSYLACIGWAVLVGAGLSRLRATVGNQPARRAAVAGATTISFFVVLSLCWLTWHYCLVWRSNLSLWTYTVEHAGDSTLARGNLADALIETDRLDEAIEQLRAARQLKPDDPNIHLARLLARTGQLAEAVQDLQSILAIRPREATWHALLAALLARQDRTDQAETHYREAIRLKPDLLQARVELALLLIERDRPQEAIHEYELLFSFEAAMGSAPWRGDALLRWGLALRGVGRAAEANLRLNQAVAAEPSLASILEKQGIVLEPVTAPVEPPDTPAANGGDGLALAKRADRLVELGRYREAIKLYDEALALLPDNVTIHLHLAETLFAIEDFTEALTHYLQAAKLGPQYAAIHAGLGRTYVELDDPQAAVRCYREAIRLKPDLLAAHYNLGIALAHLGRFDEAIEALEEALTLVEASGRADLTARIQERIQKFREQADTNRP